MGLCTHHGVCVCVCVCVFVCMHVTLSVGATDFIKSEVLIMTEHNMKSFWATRSSVRTEIFDISETVPNDR